MRLTISTALLLCLSTLVLLAPRATRAQAGPPFLSNDPGTPGNANWEINLGSMQSIARGGTSYQIPQFDLNFGLGERIQLTYQVPYVLQTSNGQPERTGWSNANPGVKWRFVDEGDDGWQVSTFPQIQTGVSVLKQQEGIAAPGPRYFLPIEVARKVGPIDVNLEAGHYFPRHGPREQIFALVVGHSLTPGLELDAEIFNDRVQALPQDTTLDFGGRYKLHRGFIALFMAGRSLHGNSSGDPEFFGYVGIQILLSHYGRTLTSEP
jgi:hypothetical protein